MLCHATKDNANDDGRHGEAQLVEEVPYKARGNHQVHVVDGVVVGVSAYEGHHYDNGQQNMHRHVYYLGKHSD